MKILIVGIVASGKTTLAKRLSKLLNIKHYEIDCVVHDDVNGIKRSEAEQKKIFNKINKNTNWIIEGTLRQNLFYLCDMADLIIYMDIPIGVRKIRILTRFIKQKLGIEKCSYKADFNMLKLMYKWTDDFEKNKGEFEDKLFKYGDKVVVEKNGKV